MSVLIVIHVTIIFAVLGIVLQMAGFGFQGTTYSLFLQNQVCSVAHTTARANQVRGKVRRYDG